MITKTEKDIYNKFLKVSRGCKNKPYTIRKNFSDIDDSTALYLKKISNLFCNYSHITPEDYFFAPYQVYPSVEYFPLEYYTKPAALNSFTMYKKYIRELPPDSDEQLEFIRKSLSRIGSFCLKHNIDLDSFPTFKTSLTYDWMKMIKKYEISIYSLMEFPKINDIIEKTAKDERELFLGDIEKYYQNYKIKYERSEIAKDLVKTGIKKIREKIKID